MYFQLNADLLLIDDKRARNFAKMNGIHTIGSLGILLMAKSDGYISNLKPVLSILVTSGVYISAAVIEDVLEKCGEKSIKF